MVWVQAWHQRTRFSELGGFGQDLAVVSATFAGQQRQQRENAGVAGRPEREWRQRMRAPPERADHMAEAPHHREGGIERGPAGGVKHDVKTLISGLSRHNGSRWLFPVHESCPKSLYNFSGRRGAGRKRRRASCASDL